MHVSSKQQICPSEKKKEISVVNMQKHDMSPTLKSAVCDVLHLTFLRTFVRITTTLAAVYSLCYVCVNLHYNTKLFTCHTTF